MEQRADTPIGCWCLPELLANSWMKRIPMETLARAVWASCRTCTAACISPERPSKGEKPSVLSEPTSPPENRNTNLLSSQPDCERLLTNSIAFCCSLPPVGLSYSHARAASLLDTTGPLDCVSYTRSFFPSYFPYKVCGDFQFSNRKITFFVNLPIFFSLEDAETASPR